MQITVNLTSVKDRDLLIPQSSGSYFDCALLQSPIEIGKLHC